MRKRSSTMSKPKVGPIATIGWLTLHFLKNLLPKNPLKSPAPKNRMTIPHKSTDSYSPLPPYFERSPADQPRQPYQQVRFLENPHPLQLSRVRLLHHPCPKEREEPQQYPYGHWPVAPRQLSHLRDHQRCQALLNQRYRNQSKYRFQPQNLYIPSHQQHHRPDLPIPQHQQYQWRHQIHFHAPQALHRNPTMGNMRGPSHFGMRSRIT